MNDELRAASDDDTPIDEAFVVGIALLGHLSSKFHLVFGGGLFLKLIKVDIYIPMPHVKTRGDLRRLCTALGQTLKEGA